MDNLTKGESNLRGLVNQFEEILGDERILNISNSIKNLENTTSELNTTSNTWKESNQSLNDDIKNLLTQINDAKIKNENFWATQEKQLKDFVNVVEGQTNNLSEGLTGIDKTFNENLQNALNQLGNSIQRIMEGYTVFRENKRNN